MQNYWNYTKRLCLLSIFLKNNAFVTLFDQLSKISYLILLSDAPSYGFSFLKD